MDYIIFIYWFLFFALWIWVWMMIYYLIYRDEKNVYQISKNLNEARKKLQDVQSERDSFLSVITQLRREIEATTNRNKDLKEIVSELNIYVNHIKKASELVKSLWIELGIFDKEVINRINKILTNDEDITEEPINQKNNWKFF